MKIASVGTAFPENYYSQQVLSEALKKRWSERHYNLERLDQLHRNVLVGGRHLALPLERYDALESFTECNSAYIEVAVEIGVRAIEEAITPLGLAPSELDHIFFVTTTGVATPSIDASIANRLPLRPDVKRSPLFGLGCVAGAVGITRAFDYLKAYPGEAAILLSVELCSLTLQREDLSIPNIIASGLFGDGAAAVVLTGDDREATGPSVVATRSVFYPDTERVMGWDISNAGFRVVLSADVPKLVLKEIRGNVDGFLESQGLTLRDIGTFICHSGGPKILDAFREALDLPEDALALTWDSLKRVGNLSSASVLIVLGDTLRSRVPTAGSYGLILAMGPGFCSELVLLQW